MATSKSTENKDRSPEEPAAGRKPGATAAGAAARILAYLKSCNTVMPAVVAARGRGVGGADTEALISALTAQQRERFAFCLFELAVASMGVSRSPGDFLSKPFPIELQGDWHARLDSLKQEFVVSGGDSGPSRRVVERLNRELLLARDARARSLRCLRLARQLSPESEEIECAFAFHRARRGAPAGSLEELATLAREAREARVRARAGLGLAALHIRKQQLKTAIIALQQSLDAVPKDPEVLARLAYCYLSLGDDSRAATTLVALAGIVENPGDGAGAAVAAVEAVQFIKSPVTGFPRLMIANPASVEQLLQTNPGFARTVLEAVQRKHERVRRRTHAHPARFLQYACTQARVPFAALVSNISQNETPDFVILSARGARRYPVEEGAIRAVMQAGGPGGVISRAVEIGEIAMVEAKEGAPPFLLPPGRGAAAAFVDVVGMPPTFLVLESDRVLACEPALVAALADDAVGVAAALWLAR